MCSRRKKTKKLNIVTASAAFNIRKKNKHNVRLVIKQGAGKRSGYKELVFLASKHSQY